MLQLSYSQKKMVLAASKIALFFIVFILLAYFILGWSIADLMVNKRWADPKFIGTGIATLFVFILGMIEISVLNKADAWLDRQVFNLKNALKGNYGEKRTFERLGQMLGEQYRIYRNVYIPGRKFDIDVIVVGPKGIITFEIKNIGTKGDIFCFEGAETYKIRTYKDNGDEVSCKLGDSNPIKEAMRHNLALEEWLMKNGYGGIKVKGAILMVGEASIEKISSPALYVITGFDGIKKYIEGTFADQRFTPEFCEKLDALFLSA